MNNKSLSRRDLKCSDAEAWVKLDHDTFRPNIGRVLWTRDPSPESFAIMAQSRRDELKLPNTYHHKIVDTDVDSENPIAFASWHIYEHERTLDQVEASCVIPDMLPERNKGACVKFWSQSFENIKQYIGGRPHMYLEMLATHPNHQRRGAGSLLMQWAVDKADELGLDAFIEASPAGRHLYSRYGFETISESLFEEAPFGVDVDELIRVCAFNAADNHNLITSLPFHDSEAKNFIMNASQAFSCYLWRLFRSFAFDFLAAEQLVQNSL